MNYAHSEILFSPKRRCSLRILIVTEARIHFAETDNGFSLSELINNALLPSARPWETVEVTTARRFDDFDCCADIPNFQFTADTFGIEKYDQVWLFGNHVEDEQGGEPHQLSKSELAILSEFMNEGGGVFATGDHASLGFALCGCIPRVRSMRKWCFLQCSSPDLKAPGIEDTTRLDTLREGIDPGFHFNDQSDSTPQEIRPKFYLDKNRKGAHAHPLLVNGDFAIRALPDHVHEGECVIPQNLKETITFGTVTFDEYPYLPDSKVRLAPEVVAISTSAGGHLLNAFNENIPPVEPKAFPIIVAYDGHQVKINDRPVGRVVVDSSFHHFLDINLKGTDSKDPRKNGFYDVCGNPTSDYLAFKKYYRNIAEWLCPPTRRVDYYHAMLLDLRFRFPLIEELDPLPEPNSRNYIFIGAVTERMISERFSRADALQCASAVLTDLTELPQKLRLAVAGLFDPWQPTQISSGLISAFLDFSSLVRLILGAAMLQVATDLPADPYEAARKLDDTDRPEKALANVISKGVVQSLEVLPDEFRRLRNSTDELLTALRTSSREDSKPG